MSDLDIRSAGPDDVATLVGLIGGFRDHLRAGVPSDADLERFLPHALTLPDLELCCAWRDGGAVGYTLTRFLPPASVPSASVRSCGRSCGRARRGACH